MLFFYNIKHDLINIFLRRNVKNINYEFPHQKFAYFAGISHYRAIFIPPLHMQRRLPELFINQSSSLAYYFSSIKTQYIFGKIYCNIFSSAVKGRKTKIRGRF